jgi:hypothetical protein
MAARRSAATLEQIAPPMPGDAHHLGRGVHRLSRPGRRSLAWCPASVPGPGHVSDHHAVGWAGHPRRIGLDERLRLTKIEGPPPSSALAGVVAAAATLASPAVKTLPARRAHEGDDGFGLLVLDDALDHRHHWAGHEAGHGCVVRSPVTLLSLRVGRRFGCEWLASTPVLAYRSAWCQAA